MKIRPYLLGQDSPSGAHPVTGPSDYRSMNEQQLVTTRDRRRRQLDELTRGADGSSLTGARRAALDAEVEQITDELIRRARQRHPSFRGLAG